MGVRALWGFLHKGKHALYYKHSDGRPSVLGRALAKQFRFLNVPYAEQLLAASTLVSESDVVDEARYDAILGNSPCPDTLETDEMQEQLKMWVQAADAVGRGGHGSANLRAAEAEARKRPKPNKTYGQVLRNVQANMIGCLATGVHAYGTLTTECIVDYVYVFDLDAEVFRILPMEYDGEHSRPEDGQARSVPLSALFDNKAVEFEDDSD